MGIKDSFKKLCTKLGEKNDPVYAVVAIAVVKGIARPIFTMMDKHADPETKKYTALREGLTEVVAIPTYITCGMLAGSVAGKLNLGPDKKAIAKNNFKFLGVCTAALLVIPALASITIKPFMDKIQENRKKTKIEIDDDEHKLDIKEMLEEMDIEEDDFHPLNPSFEGQKIVRKPYQSSYNYTPAKIGGMKVGGLW